MPLSGNGNEPDFKNMSLADIALECFQDSQEWFPDQRGDMGYLTICLAGEVGEFANMIKKGMRGSVDTDSHEFKQDLAFELTDIFIYVMNLVANMGLDMEKMYQVKRKYNDERFRKGSPEIGIIQP